jgi:hypothetical protein
MIRKHLLAFGLAGFLGTGAWAQAPIPGPAGTPTSVAVTAVTTVPATAGAARPASPMLPPGMRVMQEAGEPGADTGPAPATPEAQPAEGEATGEAAQDSGGYGPTPPDKIHILQNFLRSLCGKEPLKEPPPKKDDGCSACPAAPAPAAACPTGNCPDVLAGCEKKKDPCLVIFGWADFDYTYRSTGSGNNPIAPVMNHYGDEFLNRQDGISISKTLTKDWSWGFNMILITGSDASFLNPTSGWFQGSQFGPGGDNRWSASFTDLNLTAHLPILTDGGVDIKAGRQTTILGPMGALPFQRWFDSSDYAWYNMEEGRFTGVSSVWHITKQLDWYNGFELGWGTFFDGLRSDVDYITNISYWLDEKAQKTKIWTTVLTGPTSLRSGANTTVLELGAQQNWSKEWYQIIDLQMVWSKGPVDAVPTPGYNERAYDVYTYLGYHLSKTVDLQSRFEWYDDVDGLGYAGGFGIPHTTYYEVTLGPDYHPKSCVQFRPEIRYDYATHDAFGQNFDKRNQLSIAAEVLFKF